MNMCNRNRFVAASTLCVTALLGICANAQSPAGVTQAVEIAPGPGVFRPPVHEISPIREDMIPPPIDQIQPMPMPQSVAGLAFPSSTVTVCDATTGQVVELPGGVVTEAEGGTSISFDGVDGGGVTSYEPRGFGTMSRITSQGAFPWRMNCKLVMRFTTTTGTQVWFVCSGSMVDARTVLTAAHCVYARNPTNNAGTVFNIFNWADVIYVLPGWDGVGTIQPPNGPGGVPGLPNASTAINTHGYATGTFYMAGTNYINSGNFDADVGAVRLSDRAVGMLTGWYATTWGYNCNWAQSHSYYNVSYPAQPCGSPGLHNGQDMYYWSGSIDSCNGNQFRLDTTAGCFTAGWGGMSGSGMYWFADGTRSVHAVSSNSDRSTQANYCKVWDTFFNNLHNDFIPGSRGGAFDLQPLDVNLNGGLLTGTNFLSGSTITGNFLATNPTNGSNASTYTFRVYLSTNDQITSSDTLLSTQTFSHNFGQMSSVYVNMAPFTIPPSTPAGAYYVGVILDGATDSNSSNNATHSWDTVQVNITPPSVANDFCSGAINIGNGIYFGSTLGATVDGGANCGSSNSTRDVWYRYTAPESGNLTVATCGSSYDTVLSLHSACTGTGANQINCNDDHTGGCPGIRDSRIVQSVTRGQVILIRVSGFNGAGGHFTLNVSMLPPLNDFYINPYFFQQGGAGEGSGSIRLATNDGAASCGASALAPDVWYRLDATQDATMMVNTCGSDYDTVLSVHTGAPGTLDNEIGCNDDDFGQNCGGIRDSFLLVQVRAGLSYFVRISGYNGAVGQYQFGYNYSAPAHDTCINAAPIFVGTTAFNNTLATTDNITEANCSFCCGDLRVNGDLWYRWVAPCNATASLNTFGSGFDTKLAVYQVGCPIFNNTAYACNDDAAGGLQSSVSFSATQGRAYLIRVGGYSTSRGSGVLNLSLNCPPPCVADVDDGTFSGLPDGGVTIDDLLYYLYIFDQGTISADVDDGSFTGTPDGGVTIDDLLYFLFRFDQGC